MGNSGVSLQDNFLNQAKRENTLVSVHLTNGLKLEGKVNGFDNFTIVLNNNGREHLIYKHAVSTIIPLRAKTFVNHNHNHNHKETSTSTSCPKKKELEALADKFNKKNS